LLQQLLLAAAFALEFLDALLVLGGVLDPPLLDLLQQFVERNRLSAACAGLPERTSARPAITAALMICASS
jgi:hypothetical protein